MPGAADAARHAAQYAQALVVLVGLLEKFHYREGERVAQEQHGRFGQVAAHCAVGKAEQTWSFRGLFQSQVKRFEFQPPRPAAEPEGNGGLTLDFPVVADDRFADAAKQTAGSEPLMQPCCDGLGGLDMVRREEDHGQVRIGRKSLADLRANIVQRPLRLGRCGEGGGERHRLVPRLTTRRAGGVSPLFILQ